jgi:hypothetical protein
MPEHVVVLGAQQGRQIFDRPPGSASTFRRSPSTAAFSTLRPARAFASTVSLYRQGCCVCPKSAVRLGSANAAAQGGALLRTGC